MVSSTRIAAALGGTLLSVATVGVLVLLADGSGHAAHSPRAHVVQAPAVADGQPISSRDRVYTADMASNTVSVIDPKTDVVLGTIPLARLRRLLRPVWAGLAGPRQARNTTRSSRRL